MFAGVGERTREGNDLYREMIESGAPPVLSLLGWRRACWACWASGLALGWR